MLDTMIRYLEGVHPSNGRHNLREIMTPPIDRLSSQPVTTAGLLIGAGNLTAQIGAADCIALAAGTLVKITAGTLMPPLTGCNVPAANFNVACFYVNRAGVLTMAPGIAATTLAAVKFPAPRKNEALLGFLIINPIGFFQGGTASLTLAVTVNYVSLLGGCDPTALTG